MSSRDLGSYAAREDFVEALLREGFRRTGTEELSGRVQVPTAQGGSRRLRITIPGGFPFFPPGVVPEDDDVPWTWHRDRDGKLCLYDAEQCADLPWLRTKDLLDRTANWFAKADAQWAGEQPDLDPERYLPNATTLVLYGDFDSLNGKQIRAKNCANDCLEVSRCPHSTGGRGTVLGFAETIGEVREPPRDWVSVASLLGSRSTAIEQAARKWGKCLLLLRYQRSGLTGVLALLIGHSSTQKGSYTVLALRAASRSRDSLMLRAGPTEPLLSHTAVAVVGLGAVGSFTADCILRCGVGTLRLVDGERLRPGNCIRHLVGLQHVGKNKAVAVRDELRSRSYGSLSRIVAVPDALTAPDDLDVVLGSVDLIVDATANGSCSAMLAHHARSTGLAMLSVCILGNAEYVRVDRWPLADGEQHAARLPLSPGPVSPLHEEGCGSVVSAVSPAAVIQAASRVAGLAVAMLTRSGDVPPSVTDHLPMPLSQARERGH